MTLEIETVEQDGGVLLQVQGEVDLYTSPDLRAAIIKTIAKTNQETIGIDLGQVAYMDSSGVATLVEGLQQSQKKKIAFCLVAPADSVMKVLQLARLDSIFDIRDAM